MGIILSFLWPLSTDVDPATGLSPKDKYLVTSTWNLVKKDLTGNGVYIFELLFTKHVAVKNMFPFARDREWSQIRDDPRLRAHSNSVMYALTSFVDNLDNLPILDAMVRKMADNHVKRNVTEAHFKALGEIVLQTLSEKLGPKHMTPEATTAWTRTYGLVLKVTADQMNQGKS